MRPDVLKQLAEEWIAFNKFLGVRSLSLEPGSVLLEIPFREELIGDPVRRAIHGGVLSALADTAGGFAVWTSLEDERTRISTIDLRVDYLRPGKQEDVRAQATLVRAGKTVGVADVRLYHPSDEATTIATGKGVYAIRLHSASSATTKKPKDP
jgi:uncharacterized protein (TIGR00369 family)